MSSIDDGNDPDVPLEAPKDDDKPAVPPSTRDVDATGTTGDSDDKGGAGDA